MLNVRTAVESSTRLRGIGLQGVPVMKAGKEASMTRVSDQLVCRSAGSIAIVQHTIHRHTAVVATSKVYNEYWGMGKVIFLHEPW